MVIVSPRIRARLARVPEVARAAATQAMEEGAQDIVDEMKRLAPENSGRLRDSIGWTWGDVPAGTFVIDEIRSGEGKGDQYATLRIKFYAGSKEAFYARWVEFGTAPHSLTDRADVSRNRRQEGPKQHAGASAHPFFFPAWKANKAKFRAKIRKAVKAATRREFGNG